MSLHYHPGRDDVATDALKRLSMDRLSHVDEEKQGVVKDIHHLASL